MQQEGRKVLVGRIKRRAISSAVNEKWPSCGEYGLDWPRLGTQIDARVSTFGPSFPEIFRMLLDFADSGEMEIYGQAA